MRAALTLAVLLLSAAGARGLQCHVCSTRVPEQRDCTLLAPGEDKYLRNCSGRETASCRVIEQFLDFDIFEKKHDLDRHVIRQCGAEPFKPYEPCFYRTGSDGRMSTCYCGTDRCNGASSLAQTVILVTGLVLLTSLRQSFFQNVL